MKTKLVAAAISFLLVSGAAFAQPMTKRPQQMPMLNRAEMLKQLKLTDDQKSQIQKLRFDMMQKQIDLRAQLAHSRLDYEQLASADNPDQDAISSKIDQIDKAKVAMQKNKLAFWFDVNKVLTPDQQKVWKKVLEHPMMRRGRGEQIMIRRGPGMGNGMFEFRGMNNPRGMMNWRMNMMTPPGAPGPDSGK